MIRKRREVERSRMPYRVSTRKPPEPDFEPVEEPPKPTSSPGFDNVTFAFVLMAIPTSFAAWMVLHHFTASGFNGNIGYGMFLVMLTTPVLFLQSFTYAGMFTLSRTKASRKVLTLAGIVLALDATLMLGWGMHASGC
jgi:hypothetical protein